MTEIVFGTTDLKEFEVLECETTFTGIKKYRNKKIDAKTLLEILKSMNYTPNEKVEKEIYSINIFDTFKDGLISHKKTDRKDILVFDFKEQMIRTFYNDKYYKIVHCNAFIRIFVTNGKINDMEIYPYKKYNGKKTELFDNPYPNMYSGNKSCIGTADREIKGTYKKTILGLLEISYTHAYTAFKDKELHDTVYAFEYLSKNPFPYEKLRVTKKTLKDII